MWDEALDYLIALGILAVVVTLSAALIIVVNVVVRLGYLMTFQGGSEALAERLFRALSGT